MGTLQVMGPGTPTTGHIGSNGGADDDATTAMVLATHDLRPVPHLPINREKALQIAWTVECSARRQRRKLSGSPTSTHIKMIEFESNETKDLNDKQTEADAEKPVGAQVAAKGGTDTRDDDATAAMVLFTKNTHDLGSVPHLPTNEVPEELINLGAENIATAAGPNDIHDTHDIHDIHNLGKVDLNSGGTSGQVEQGAANQVVEDQALVVDTSLLKDRAVKEAPRRRTRSTLGRKTTTAVASLSTTREELADG